MPSTMMTDGQWAAWCIIEIEKNYFHSFGPCDMTFASYEAVMVLQAEAPSYKTNLYIHI